jgi:hypothetical protein
MPRARGLWLGLAVTACLALAGCAEGALVTPTPPGSAAAHSPGQVGSQEPAGSGGSTDGAPASGGVSAAPSESAAVGVVDETAGRYDDGLPKIVDGLQVLRDGDAIAHAKAATSTNPFYLGAWLTPVTPKPSTASPQPCPGAGCGPQIAIADKAGSIDPPLNKATDFHQLAGVALAAGPVVLQVHSQDPNAVCGDKSCNSTMVVDAVIWNGDAATAPAPYTVDDVTAAITNHLPDTSFQAIGTPIVDCGTQLPATTLLVTVPPADESGISAPRDWVSSVSIAPSVAAMNEALDSVAKAKTPSARPGTENVLSKANLVCREQPGGPFRTFRYLVLDNIAVVIATSSDPSLEERVFITQLANALQTQIAEPTPSPAPSASESAAPSSSPVSGPTKAPHRTPKPGKP